MKIAFTAKGTDLSAMIDPRFGRTDYIVLLDDNSGAIQSFDNRATGNEAHGAGTATAQKIFDLAPDILITGNGPGDHAARALEHSQIRIFINAHNLTLGEAFTSFKEGKLTEL